MLTGFFDQSHGQYLNREYYPLWANEDYENYAHFSYRDIRLRRLAGGFFLDEETRVYDPFGFTLLTVPISTAPRNSAHSPFGGSIIFKDDDYRDLFQNLVVASDSYQDWGSSVILGRAVEARFKPMMLSLNRMNGIRWDSNSQRNRFTILGSRISEPLRNFASARPLDFVTISSVDTGKPRSAVSCNLVPRTSTPISPTPCWDAGRDLSAKALSPPTWSHPAKSFSPSAMIRPPMVLVPKSTMSR